MNTFSLNNGRGARIRRMISMASMRRRTTRVVDICHDQMGTHRPHCVGLVTAYVGNPPPSGRRRRQSTEQVDAFASV